MATLKEIEEDIDLISTIKDITGTYQTLANMRVRRIRDEVLKTRTFLEGIAKIYHHAKTAYLGSLEEGEKLEQASFITRNKKRVTVFLSANERFYGTLLLDTWQRIQHYVRNNTTDLAVVGDIGKRFTEQQSFDTQVKYFNLDDEHPTQKQKRMIFEHIKNYEDVIVFHGRFKSAFRQQPTKTNVSGGITLEQAPDTTKDYIFEPSPEAILEFFEEEIIGALFNQTILEHQLARFASRMVAMDQATQNADEKLDNLEHQATRLKRRVQNKKQLERIIRSKSINKR
ncbi:MAG: F0F1 ATP synthase subunit gamma [Candidatus Paceibacterota bacterium]